MSLAIPNQNPSSEINQVQLQAFSEQLAPNHDGSNYYLHQ